MINKVPMILEYTIDISSYFNLACFLLHNGKHSDLIFSYINLQACNTFHTCALPGISKPLNYTY